MSPRDLVYVGHMLDMAKKTVSKTKGLSRDAYDADENLRLALIHLIHRSLVEPAASDPVLVYNSPGTLDNLRRSR